MNVEVEVGRRFEYEHNGRAEVELAKVLAARHLHAAQLLAVVVVACVVDVVVVVVVAARRERRLAEVVLELALEALRLAIVSAQILQKQTFVNICL